MVIVHCAEMLLGTGILVEVNVDSVDVWMEGTDLCKSWSIQDSNGTCQCAQRSYLIRCYAGSKLGNRAEVPTYDDTSSIEVCAITTALHTFPAHTVSFSLHVEECKFVHQVEV